MVAERDQGSSARLTEEQQAISKAIEVLAKSAKTSPKNDGARRADSAQQTNPRQATTPRRKADFVEVAIRVLETGVKSIGLVVFVIERLTGRWSCFPIGAVAGYMTLLNIEGYYNALGRPDSFLPKPYIQDGASLANLATAVNNPQFWLATVIGICSSAVAAKWWRDRQTIAEAKAKFNEVKNERTGDLPDDAIDLAKYRRKKLKRAGMKRIRLLGLLFLICLGTDVATAIVNYPLSGKNFLVHFIWALLSVFGSEIFLAAFQDSWEELRKDPKVEVVR